MAARQAAPVFETRAFEPMGGRARAASALLWLCALLSVVGVISDVLEYSLLGRFERGDFVSQAEAIDAAEANDVRQGTIGLSQLVLVVVTGAVFIAWFYGMYKNLRAMGRVTRFGTGWAIGGWFVPILGLWRPKQIADDIYRNSDPSAKPDDLWPSDTNVPQVVHWWWGTFVASLILWRVADALSRDTSTIETLKTSSLFAAASDLLDLVAAVLAVVVVRRLTDRQDEWAARHLGQQAISSPT